MLKQFFGSIEVFLYEYLGVIIRAFCAFLAKAIHIIPAKLTDNMLKFAGFTVKAEAHVEVGATLVDVPERAMLSFLALLPHKIRTYF